MHRWHPRQSDRGKSISWLLILAFALLALQPVHIHMAHHADSALSHSEHLAQVHPLAVLDGLASDLHDHTFEPLSDSILKSSGFQVPLLALLMGMMTLLPRLARAGVRPDPIVRPLTTLFRHRTPPLRAPPRA